MTQKRVHRKNDPERLRLLDTDCCLHCGKAAMSFKYSAHKMKLDSLQILPNLTLPTVPLLVLSSSVIVVSGVSVVKRIVNGNKPTNSTTCRCTSVKYILGECCTGDKSPPVDGRVSIEIQQAFHGLTSDDSQNFSYFRICRCVIV